MNKKRYAVKNVWKRAWELERIPDNDGVVDTA